MELEKYIKKVVDNCKKNNLDKVSFDINILLHDGDIVVTNQPTNNKIKFVYNKPKK